jgi:hypothetical protein
MIIPSKSIARPSGRTVILAAALLAGTVFVGPMAQAQTPYLSSYKTEQLAQAHCPRDQVVWVEMKTGIYHFRGDRLFGETQSGAYACRREVDASGGRLAVNKIP